MKHLKEIITNMFVNRISKPSIMKMADFEFQTANKITIV